MPELERYILHKLHELDATIRKATKSMTTSASMPRSDSFMASDLSAFYFDIRKDSLYCDAWSTLPGAPAAL